MRLIFLIGLVISLASCSQREDYNIAELKIMAYSYKQIHLSSVKDTIVVIPRLFASINDSGICDMLRFKNPRLFNDSYKFKKFQLDSSSLQGLIRDLNTIKSDTDFTPKEFGNYDGPEICIFYKNKHGALMRVMFIDNGSRKMPNPFYIAFYYNIDSNFNVENKKIFADTINLCIQRDSMKTAVKKFSDELLLKYDSVMDYVRVGVKGKAKFH